MVIKHNGLDAGSTLFPQEAILEEGSPYTYPYFLYAFIKHVGYCQKIKVEGYLVYLQTLYVFVHLLLHL